MLRNWLRFKIWRPGRPVSVAAPAALEIGVRLEGLAGAEACGASGQSRPVSMCVYIYVICRYIYVYTYTCIGL